MDGAPSPSESDSVQAVPWKSLSDSELLQRRICDLKLELKGTELSPLVEQLYAELENRGLSFRPRCYLGDEWFSALDVPTIAIPFYLAHPRLVALEKRMMLEVEGGEPAQFMQLLRHECGHALEHAYQLHRRRKRQTLFGPRSIPYAPETYRPRPYSRSYVRNLPNWYAQAHPDEDFAETFAVWLDPSVDWRKHYSGWKALTKLEYVDSVMREMGRTAPRVTDDSTPCHVSRLRARLETFYKRRRKEYAVDAPDFYDRDLEGIFTREPPARETSSAASFFRHQRRELVDSVARWTGERKVAIELLVRRLSARSAELKLFLARDERRTSIEVTAYVATLVTHYRFTGRFKRSV